MRRIYKSLSVKGLIPSFLYMALLISSVILLFYIVSPFIFFYNISLIYVLSLISAFISSALNAYIVFKCYLYILSANVLFLLIGSRADESAYK